MNDINSLNKKITSIQSEYDKLNLVYEPFQSLTNDFVEWMNELSMQTVRYLITLENEFDIIEIKSEDEIKFLVLLGILHVEPNENYNNSKKRFEYKLTVLGRLFQNFLKLSEKV